jgi:hypothetical protein
VSIDSLLGAFIAPLEREGIEYAIAGSVASIAYGEPRMTMDIDLVAALGPNAMPSLARAFPESRFYLPPGRVIVEECSRASGGHFNVIDQQTGLKADFYVAQRDPLQSFAIERRRRIELGEFSAWLAPPEYVIVRKLESWREGGSAKHVRDIRGMLEGSVEVDRGLVQTLATERGLDEFWRQVQQGR